VKANIPSAENPYTATVVSLQDKVCHGLKIFWLPSTIKDTSFTLAATNWIESVISLVPNLNLKCSILKCLYNKRRWRAVKHNSSNDKHIIRATCFDSTESSSGPGVLDLYKECTTHCGIPSAYNNRDKLQKTVNNTEYVCVWDYLG